MIQTITKAQLSILETKRERVRQLLLSIDAIQAEAKALLEITDRDVDAQDHYPAADYLGDFIGCTTPETTPATDLCEWLGIEIAG